MASPCSVELEVMTKNYAKLCEVLSPVIDSMLPKLLSEKVITYEDKKNILVKQTGTCKAEALLDGTIKTSLSVDYPDSFYKLLRVMKDTQSNVCIQLVENMTGELPSDMVAKFNLESDGGEQDQSADHEPEVDVQQNNSAAKPTPKSCAKESQQPSQKNPITLLQEYCQQRKVQCPLYEIQPVKTGSGFYCRVTVEGKMYLGSTKSNKKEAKQSAAEKALELHTSTPTPDSTVNPSLQKSPSDSYKQQLKMKYFDRKNVPFPYQKGYFVTKPVDGGFQCVLSIPRQRDFKSAVLPSKLAAENDAAKCALDFFKL